MSKLYRIVSVGLVVVIVASLSLGAVYAQDTDGTDDTTTEESDAPSGRGRGGGHFAELAEALGIAQSELRTLMQEGAEAAVEAFAAEQGVDLEALQAEWEAERLAQIEERLNEAVANNRITQEEADAMLESIANGERPDDFFGRRGGRGRGGPDGGRGRGGPGGGRGPGGFGFDQPGTAAPDAATTANADI